MHVGNKEIGKDGIQYRSSAEREFADQFLYGKFSYTYERPYENNTKYTCDFYLPQLKLWIEVVPYEEKTYEKKEVFDLDSEIFLTTQYKDKDIVKYAGALWHKTRKQWYIRDYMFEKFYYNPSLNKFLAAMYVKTIDNTDDSDYINFFDYREKIEKKRTIVVDCFKEYFMVVNPSDLRFDSLCHLLVGKFPNNGWIFCGLLEKMLCDKEPLRITDIVYEERVIEKPVLKPLDVQKLLPDNPKKKKKRGHNYDYNKVVPVTVKKSGVR